MEGLTTKMMDKSKVVSVVAAAAAIAAAISAFAALRPAERAARAAEEQLGVQYDLARQAAQPYVWADIQPDGQQGTLLHLVLGNAGPTVAHNVRVVITPPISGGEYRSEYAMDAQRRLSEGVLSLAPGRTIRWSLGRAYDLLDNVNDGVVYRMRVTAEGPFGKVEPLEIAIRPSDWRESLDAPVGSLHYVRKELERLVKAVEHLGR